MTTPSTNVGADASRGHTPGQWDIYRQPLRNRIHACWELIRLVFGTKSFVPTMPMIVSPDGKCPAVTGCGAKAEANAAFIVRACNSHYELLEALDRCAAFWDMRIDELGRLSPELTAIREFALTAIAKARPTPPAGEAK